MYFFVSDGKDPMPPQQSHLLIKAMELNILSPNSIYERSKLKAEQTH